MFNQEDSLSILENNSEYANWLLHVKNPGAGIQNLKKHLIERQNEQARQHSIALHKATEAAQKAYLSIKKAESAEQKLFLNSQSAEAAKKQADADIRNAEKLAKVAKVQWRDLVDENSPPPEPELEYGGAPKGPVVVSRPKHHTKRAVFSDMKLVTSSLVVLAVAGFQVYGGWELSNTCLNEFAWSPYLAATALCLSFGLRAWMFIHGQHGIIYRLFTSIFTSFGIAANGATFALAQYYDKLDCDVDFPLSFSLLQLVAGALLALVVAIPYRSEPIKYIPTISKLHP